MEYHLNNQEADVLIIEKINSQDCDRALEIINEYRSKTSESIKIWFNADNEDEDTLGLADELECDIYNTQAEIWDAISEHFKIYTGTKIESIAKEINGKDLDGQDTAEMFGFDPESMAQGQEIIDEDTKHESIGSLSDIEQFDDTYIIEYLKHQESIQAKSSQEQQEQQEHQEQQDIQATRAPQASSGVLVAEVNKLSETIAKLNRKVETLQSRLDSEVKLRGVIQDERDSIKTRLVEILNTKKVVEENVPAQEYRKLINKYTSLQEQLESSEKERQGTNRDTEEKLNNYRSQVASLQEELESRKLEIQKLNDSIEAQVKSVQSESLNQTALQAALDQTKNHLKEAEENLEKQNSKLVSLESSLREKSDEIARIREEFENLENQEKAHKAAFEMHNEILSNTLKIVRDYAQQAFESSQEIRELEQSVEQKNVENESLTEQLKQRDTKIDRLDRQVQDLKSEIELTKSSVELQKAEIQEENNKLRANIMQANTQISTLRNQLTTKDSQLRNLSQSIGPVDPATGQPRALQNLRNLEIRNRDLQNQVASLNQQLQVQKAESQQATSQHSKLVTENQNLKRSLNAYINSGYSGGQILPISINGGKAKIIAVFGTGSFGISCLAYSIAQKLSQQSTVMLMDLDLTTPKLDSYFKRLPYATIPGVPNQTTALEVFINQGIDRVWANATALIPQLTPNQKNGRLWWFQGLYNKVDDTQVITADWSALFNKLSPSFDYIVIDCGKFGYNTISDQLTKNISKIAYRQILVQGTDYSDVSLTLKQISGQIRRDNLIWMMNQSLTTNLKESTKHLLMNETIEIMPFSQGTFGKRQSMIMDTMLRGRLEGFILNNIAGYRNKIGED